MFDQVLLRIGINSSAVSAGLGRVTGLVKGWTTSIAHHLTGALGGIFAFAAIERGFERIKERILAIKRVSADLGVNTNFAQNLMIQSENQGLDMEAFEKPLLRFSALIGQAKEGSVEARKKLVDWGLATKESDFKAMNLQTGLVALSKSFEGLNDAEKRNAMLSDLTVKGLAALVPILESGATQIEKMGKSNFFSNLTPQSITFWQKFWVAAKTVGRTVYTTGANLIAGVISRRMDEIPEIGKVKDAQEKVNKLTAENISLEQKRLEYQSQMNQLKERESELTAEISDRGKPTLEALASQGRRITGMDKVPRGLASVRVLSPAIRQAMAISSMEDREAAAFAMGNNSQAQALRSEADKMRAASPFLRREDKFPMAKTESELESIDNRLKEGLLIKAFQTQ